MPRGAPTPTTASHPFTRGYEDLHPGETILAHTQEFIGGRECVTTMMKARSSLGRVFVAVCKCAGWGDVEGQTLTVTVNQPGAYRVTLFATRADDLAAAEFSEFGVEYPCPESPP